MLESFRADPCRFVAALLDIRQLIRLWRGWRQRGTAAILDELSVADSYALTSGESVSEDHQPVDPTQRKCILVIDACIPRFDRDAGARSSFFYLHLLREMGHEVYFMPNDQLRREPYATALENSGIKLLIGYGCGRWAKWLSTHGSRIQHVVLHRPNIARRYLEQLRQLPELNLLYFAHDLRHIRELRHYQLSGDSHYKREAEYWLNQERKILAAVNHAYFFSAEEAALVREWQLGCNDHTIPLYPVDPADIEGLPFDQRSGLLFVGSFTHQPNLDAALWFAREVFPKVRRVLPDLTWSIVGRSPPPEVADLAGNGIIVRNNVSDDELTMLYQSAKLVVAPLRFGAGVKGKVVDAMCAGTPVVTTQIGAEGMTNIQGCVEVADTTAAEMSEKILSLCCNPTHWESLRQRALMYARENFSRQAAMDCLAAGLREVKSANCRPRGVAGQ